MKKQFGLHFRYRDSGNNLLSVGMVCESPSQKDARQTGKNIANARATALTGPGGVWFMGLISVDEAKIIGGELP